MVFSFGILVKHSALLRWLDGIIVLSLGVDINP